MAFVPLIDFCIEKNDDGDYEVIVTDITDVYDDPDNLTGWEHADTLLASEVTALTLTVTYEDENNVVTETEYDILDQLTDPVEGEIEFDPIVYSGDGYYKIVYTVTAGVTSYTACKIKIPYPELACCISKKVLKLANSACSCTNNTNLYNIVNELKALERAYNEAVKTIDKDTALDIYDLLDDICSSSSGCGCK
jgi:hypothetical protein